MPGKTKHGRAKRTVLKQKHQILSCSRRAFVFTRVIPDYVPALNAGLGAHSLLLQKKTAPSTGGGLKKTRTYHTAVWTRETRKMSHTATKMHRSRSNHPHPHSCSSKLHLPTLPPQGTPPVKGVGSQKTAKSRCPRLSISGCSTEGLPPCNVPPPGSTGTSVGSSC